MLRFFLIFCICSLFSSLAQAASFDCDKASHPVEHAICANEELSELDDTLANIFEEAQYGIVKGDTALLDEQRGWLRQMRGDCQAAEDIKLCVGESYEQRLKNLTSIPWSLHILYEPEEIVRIRTVSPHYDFELALDPPFGCEDKTCQEDRQLAIFTKGEKSPHDMHRQAIEFTKLSYVLDKESGHIFFKRTDLGRPEKLFEFGDFNFDGHTDFIFFGHDEGSHRLIRKPFVFLYNPEYHGFYYAPSLSALFQGLWLKNNPKDKQQIELHTDDVKRELRLDHQDGCCFHVSTFYQIKNNMPVPLRRYSQDSRLSKGKDEMRIYEDWRDGKWQLSAYQQ